MPTVSRFERRRPSRAGEGFLFVGRLVDSKGVEVLLDAYQRAGLDPAVWPLTIVGDGPMRPELEARCCGRRLARGVRFLGFVDDETKARLVAVGEMARGAVTRA